MLQFHVRPTTQRNAAARYRVLVGWHDRVSRALARGDPHLAVFYGSLVGRIVGRLRLYGATPDEIGALFGSLPDRRRRAIAQTVCAAAWMDRVVSPLVQRVGYDDFNRMVVSHCDEQIRRLHWERRAAILGFMHSGPLLGMSSTLHRLEIPALVITRARHHRGKTPLDVCHVADTAASRRFTLKRAVDKLRTGGIVLWALDLPGTSRLRVRIFGRELAFARGPFAAARLSGALLLPLTACWTSRRRIEVRSGEPLGPPGHASRPSDHSRNRALAMEQALAADASAWFEDYYRKHPEQISMALLRKLFTQ